MAFESVGIITTRNGSGAVIGYREDLAQGDVMSLALTGPAAQLAGVTSVKWELVGRPAFSAAGGAGPEPIALGTSPSVSFTVDTDVGLVRKDGTYVLHATINPGAPGGLEVVKSVALARSSGLTIPTPTGLLNLRKLGGFEELEDTSIPAIVQGWKTQLDGWLELVRQVATGGGGSFITLAGAYAQGTVAGDQTLALTDAKGGGLIIDATSGSYTGQSAFKVNLPAGGPLVVDRATGRLGVGTATPALSVHAKGTAPGVRLERIGGASLDLQNVTDDLQILNGATLLGAFKSTGGLQANLGVGIGVAPVTGPALAFGAGSAVGISAAGTARFRYNEGTGHAEWSENGGAYQPFASPFSAYQTIDNAGTPLTQRTILNFSGGLVAVDNAGATRTDVSTLLTAPQIGFGSVGNALIGDGRFAYPVSGIFGGTVRQLTIGDTNPVDTTRLFSLLSVVTEGTTLSSMSMANYVASSTIGVSTTYIRASGSQAAPTAITANQAVATFTFETYDSGNTLRFPLRQVIYVPTGAAIGANSVPLVWVLQVNNNASVSTPNTPSQWAFGADTSFNAITGHTNLVTNAADGFLYLPSASGAFTGTPNNVFGGSLAQNRTPIGIDVTDGTGRLYAYIAGAWHFVAFNDAATLFYQTVDNAGSPLTQRPVVNFSGGLLAVDNGGATRTDVTTNLGATQVGFGSGANTLAGSAGWTFDSTNIQATFTAAGTPTKTWQPVIINQTGASGSTVTTSDIRWLNNGTKAAAIRHFSATTGSLDTIHIGSYSGSPLGEGVLFGSYSPITDSLSNVTLEVLPFLQDIFLGAGAQLATNAASGFVLLPRIAGTPTVAPTSQGGGGLSPGRISTVVDDGNAKVWYYVAGAWHFVSMDDGFGYTTIDNAGTPLTQRTILNFSGGLVAVDNAGATRTDVTTSLTATQIGFGGGSNTMVGDPNLNWDTTNGLLKIGSGTAYSVNDVAELTKSRNGITRVILNNPNVGASVSASLQISAGSATPLTNQLNITFISPGATTIAPIFVAGSSLIAHVNSTGTPFVFWNDSGVGGDFVWYTQVVGPIEQLRLTNNGDVLGGQNAFQWDNTNKRFAVGDLPSALPGVAGQVHVVQSGTNNKRGLIIDTSLNTAGAGTFGGRITFRRASGTFSTPTAVSGGASWDDIGWMEFDPHDGTNFVRTVTVGAHVTPGATVATGNVPTTFVIAISPTGNTNWPNGEVFQLTDTTLSLFGDFLYSAGLTPPRMAIQQSGGSVTAANIPHQLSVIDETGFGARGIQVSTHRDATGTSGAGVFLERSRGTFAAPTTTAADDGVGQIFFQGYNGTTYLGAGIAAVVDHAATVDSTHTPVNIEFRTNAGAFYATPNGAQGIVGYNGDFVWGTNALATNATQGFVWLRTTAGVPSQAPVVPTYNGVGTAVDAIATIIDSTDARLYAYVGGAWHYAAFNDGGAAPFYQTVDNAGSAVTQRATLNFSGGLLAVDNAGAVRTDVTTTLTATQVGFGGGSNTMIGSAHLTFTDAATAVLAISSASTSAQLALNNVTSNTANRISFQQSGTTFGQFTFTKNTGVSNHAFVIVFQSAAPTADYLAVTNDVSAMAPLIAFASSGDVGIGSNLGVGLADTAGFAYLPVSAGVPTGVPAPNAAMGTRNAFVADTTDDRLYLYRSGWKPYGQFTGGLATGYLRSATTTGLWTTTATIPASDITGLFYQTVDAAGSPLTQRPILNLNATMSAVDNAGATRTDVGVALPAAGRVLVSAGAGATIDSDANVTVDTTAHELAIGASGVESWYRVAGANFEKVRAHWGTFPGSGVTQTFNLTSEQGGSGTVRDIAVDAGTAHAYLAGSQAYLFASPALKIFVDTAGGNAGLGAVNIIAGVTVPSATSATLNVVNIGDGGSTFISGTTHVTTAAGFNFFTIAVPTYDGLSASKTIDIGATVYIQGAPTTAHGVTLTNPLALWVDSGTTRLDGIVFAGPQVSINGAALGTNDALTIAPSTDNTKDHVKFFLGGGTNVEAPDNAFFQIFHTGATGIDASNAGGILATQRLGRFAYTALSGSPVVGEATTLYIENAPTLAAGASGPLYALHVAAGATSLDGDVMLAGALSNLSFFGAGGGPQFTVGGSRSGVPALASLLSILATYGIVVDGSSP